VFILAFSVFSGVVALALRAEPGALEFVLPRWGIYVWNGTLIVGSAIALMGMWIQSINGIIIEQVGSAMVSVATVFYAILILVFAGSAATISAGIILAWGIACALRYFQLQILIDVAYREKIIMGAEQAIAEQIFGDDEDG